METELIKRLKEIYIKAKDNKFIWKPLYPNNMPCNGVEGLYTDMFFKNGDKYDYIKFTIEYIYRCDEQCTIYPEEGIKGYALYSLKLNDLDSTFEIPEPSDKFDIMEDRLADMVNDYGDFNYVFGTEDIAKGAAVNTLLGIIFPYLYILNNEEAEEWKRFIKEREQQ